MTDKKIEDELKALLNSNEQQELDFIQVVALLGAKKSEEAGFISLMVFVTPEKCDLNRILIAYFHMRNNARYLREMIQKNCGKRPEDVEHLYQHLIPKRSQA